jgi:hypothetical protein
VKIELRSRKFPTPYFYKNRAFVKYSLQYNENWDIKVSDKPQKQEHNASL